MAELKLQGKILKIGELESFESGFRKVEFILKTEGEYSQEIKFESHKDKAENFIKYNKEGDDVDVSFNIKGNEHNDKYYVNLVAWRTDKIEDKENF